MLTLLAFALGGARLSGGASPATLKVGVACVSITPFGPNPDWDGTVTESGVWGERFTDTNHNGRWDLGEPFHDDPGNTAIDKNSDRKYDGIYLAGFGHNRLATGKHDDLWARALVLDQGSARLAIVSVDLIGYYSKANYYGLEEVKKLIDPALGIGEILIASTHNHDGPDTIGPWGTNLTSDGKYPKYLRFVDRQIARAVNLAAKSSIPARMKVGVTNPGISPSIQGMQTRTFGRPPRFFDEELRVMQFVAVSARASALTSGTGSASGGVIATVINWNTHPESMEDGNTVISSDFPHALREAVEKRYGGKAVYLSGDLGAVEIIGDSNNKVEDRSTFDGNSFPLRTSENRPAYTFERTEAIGRDVAKAVVDAVGRAEWNDFARIDLKKARLSAPMDNAGYLFLAGKGILSTLPMPRQGEAPRIDTWVYLLTMGNIQMLTAPGELFPEVFYGVEKHRRRDCAPADTGRPAEIAVRELTHAKYRFLIGLCPDELGYIVPGYDFLAPSTGLAGPSEARDPCKAAGVPDHYHETNSASSQLARAWACTAATLLDGKTHPGCAQ
jgi:hypothetical protein